MLLVSIQRWTCSLLWILIVLNFLWKAEFMVPLNTVGHPGPEAVTQPQTISPTSLCLAVDMILFFRNAVLILHVIPCMPSRKFHFCIVCPHNIFWKVLGCMFFGEWETGLWVALVSSGLALALHCGCFCCPVFFLLWNCEHWPQVSLSGFYCDVLDELLESFSSFGRPVITEKVHYCFSFPPFEKNVLTVVSWRLKS